MKCWRCSGKAWKSDVCKACLDWMKQRIWDWLQKYKPFAPYKEDKR